MWFLSFGVQCIRDDYGLGEQRNKHFSYNNHKIDDRIVWHAENLTNKLFHMFPIHLLFF